MESSERLTGAVRRLESAGIESPRLEAQLLLALALGATRTRVVAGLAPEPTEEQERELERLVSARERRTPLAYLRGTQEFFGLSFMVGPAVLIPRPETELLVEFALEAPAAAVVADVCTGSGCILIAALTNAPRATGIGWDLSEAALRVAHANILSHGIGERARLVRADLLQAAAPGAFDVVVANPPYIPSADIAGLAPEVRDSEPRLALDGGDDGLECFRRLAVEARRALRSGGRFGVEVGQGQAPVVANLLRAGGWHAVAARRDLAGIERVVCARKAEP